MKTFMTLLLLSFLFTACSSRPQAPVEPAGQDSMITLFDRVLKENILASWYPRMTDTLGGGFLSNAAYDWTPGEQQPKMLVTQSRHLWTASSAALFSGDSTYTRYARHAYHFVTGKMWDPVYGGFFTIRSREGEFTDLMYGNNKLAYGNAFAIYGLTAWYQLSRDTAALEWAKKGFHWLEQHAHDPQYGGYIDPMDQQGNWLTGEKGTNKAAAGIGMLKDYNSSIHLMEAFTELVKVWPDPLVKTRLQEMLVLVRDTFTNEKGYLNLNFTREWQLVSLRDSSEQAIRRHHHLDYISFGHDVETAFLMLEASEALGIENDTTTLRIAKRVVDHALANGFDEQSGGFFNEGYYFPGSDSITILSQNAEWWGQAEGLNALLMMAKIFPEEPKYYEAYLKVWNYIDNYLIDHQHGEWYIIGSYYNPDVVKAPKASVWKGNYHNGRAMMNCIRMLRDESSLITHFAEVKTLLRP